MNEYEKNIEIMKELRGKIDAVLKDRPSDIGVALTEPLGIPDPVKHQYISFAKSFVRIVAGVCLVVGFPVWCGVGLIAAEALGIVEELV